MNNTSFPIRVPIIRVSQKIGDFYAASLPASFLCEVAFSVKAFYSKGKLTGTQRKIKEDRTSLISEYISSDTCTFPNAVILGANFNQKGDYVESDSTRWFVEENKREGGGCNYVLVIPSAEKVVSIIDGQHRLDGFRKYFSSGDDRKDMDLLCSIFFDIPSPVQAEIFATINYNQKPVDKSLAYQLFGYSLDTKSSDEWEPDNLALHIARILDKEEDSPFFGMITSGADEEKGREGKEGFTVSTAAVVEGVVKLFSSNPVKDRYRINQKSLFASGRKKVKDLRSTAPLRQQYINNEDRKIYDIVVNFFDVAMKVLVSPSKVNSKLRSTIGILALFDTLKHILQTQKSLSAGREDFLDILDPCLTIDFSDEFFSAAGIGRSRIKNAIIFHLNINSVHHQKILNRMKPELKEVLNDLV